MRRNPDPTRSPRRTSGWHLPVETRRRALWRRLGWPRGMRMRDGWFLGVDPCRASDAWVARVYALPPRPRGGVASARGRAWLARLEALRPAATLELAAMRGDRRWLKAER